MESFLHTEKEWCPPRLTVSIDQISLSDLHVACFGHVRLSSRQFVSGLCVCLTRPLSLSLSLSISDDTAEKKSGIPPGDDDPSVADAMAGSEVV